MHLTLYSDYALRTLIYLALHGGKVTIAEVAERYGISRNHLVKVAQKLGHLGYIDAVRGKQGGLRLGRAPSDINLGEVIRQCEPHLDLLECFNRETNTCPIAGACALEGVMRQARGAFLAVLDQYTLADLTRNGAEIHRLLRIDAPD